MSHFSLLVVGPDIERQLAPFQENNMGTCEAQYLTFHDIEDEYLRQYETDSSDMIGWNGQFLYPWDERFRIPGTMGTGSHTHLPPPELPRLAVPHVKRFPTFEAFMKDYVGHKERDPKTQRFGYWENPNAKWDWWVIGGRWGGFFIPKPGRKGRLGAPSSYDKVFGDERDHSKVDQLLKGDIDFDRMGDFSTHAVLKDGKWYERGEMGWFGCVSGEKDEDQWEREFASLIKELPDSTLLTVVDCHI